MTITATPTTPKEWEEYVNQFATPADFTKALQDGSFTNAINAYKNSSNQTMDALKQEVTEQVQASIVDMFKRNGASGDQVTNRLELVNAARAKAAASKVLYNERAIGAGLNGLFDTAADYFQTIWHQANLKDDAREKFQTLRNYSEKVPSEGGFLVPEEFRSDMLSVALEKGIVRPRAHVVPMATGKLKYPAIDMSTEVGEVYGGIVMYWMDEGQTIPDTSATFAALELIAHKLGGSAIVPNELVRDWGAFTSWIQTMLPQAIMHFEDIGFLKGNGVAKPLGALHASNPALITVAKETNQPAASFTWINAISMYARLLPESVDNAVWVVTPDAFPELATMALPVGTGGSAVWMPDAHGRPQLTLLGLPVVVSRKAPGVLGAQGDVSLVDFSKYLIGDTQTMSVESSAHVRFLNDQTVWRVIERVDGQPQLLTALTPENGGPTLSSFVQLAVRA
jgi:HK97 family phage major capsid protein